MASCKSTPKDFIKGCFSPQVAVLCSEDAETVCLKNNLRFVELIQPFSNQKIEGCINDLSGNAIPLNDLKVIFEDMNHRPPQPILGKKLLSEVVLTNTGDQPNSRNVNNISGGLNLDLSLHSATPWFEAWREMFLNIQYPSDHEFTKHYVACIIVVSAGSVNVLEQVNRLSQYQHQQQHQTPARYPKWFSPNILKYYVLLHDVSQCDMKVSEKVYEQMSTSYGSGNCHLLQINSRASDHTEAHMSDPWKQFLKKRGLADIINDVSGSSETSSGTATPKEDVVGLPSTVTEGDTTDSPEAVMHPLSPVHESSPPNEKNGQIENIPPDVPLMLISTNSTANIESQQHGNCLTSSDLDRIKIFLHEFCLRALLPYVERQIRYLNEAVTNRSRSKSLLSATRRWLGGNKPSGNTSTQVIYSQEATELQVRRLGDLCFMFGLYEAAFSAYHTAKNDFKNDQAWLYFAGALEMAALAAFMHNSSDFPKRYLDESIHTYLHVCKVYNYAIRSTLLSTEVMKHNGELSDAAMMMIKLTSEDSDLLSALMLEQAALCFVNRHRPLPRKYAFHMTLAGHRFSKAGQKTHSYRSYKQAFQVYSGRNWLLAEDHIHFTMGKQAQHMKEMWNALQSYSHLVDQQHKDAASSKQSPTQQLAYIREYLTALMQYSLQDNSSMQLLPLPVIDGQRTKVLVGTPAPPPQDSTWTQASHLSFGDDDSRNKRWIALELEAVNYARHPSRMIFKPKLELLTSSTPNVNSPSVPIDEEVCFQVVLLNPLELCLTMLDIRLVYDFKTEETHENKDYVYHEPINEVVLHPNKEQLLLLKLSPKCLGKLLIQGLSYKLCLTPENGSAITNTLIVSGQQMLSVTGPRLNTNMNERTNVVYAVDRRLELNVDPPMPRLQLLLKTMPSTMKCGQLCKVEALITNTGPTAVGKLVAVIGNPKEAYFDDDQNISSLNHTKILTETQSRLGSLKSRASNIDLPDNTLESGQQLLKLLWIHAPHDVSSETFDVEILLYYESAESGSKKRYRLLRHVCEIILLPSLSLTIESSISQKSQDVETQHSIRPHSVNLALSLHCANQNTVTEEAAMFTIMSISGNSKRWAVMPLNPTTSLKVLPNEECRFCIKCIQLLKVDKIETQACSSASERVDKLLFSHLPLSHNENPVSCWWQFSLRERIKLKDLLAEPSPPDPAADLIPPPPSQEEIDALYMNESLNLNLIVSVIWKYTHNGEEIWGQHNVMTQKLGESVTVPPSAALVKQSDVSYDDYIPVRIIPLKPDITSPSPLPSHQLQQHLVKVTVNTPDVIEHNFHKSRLCTFQLKVTLNNCTDCELVTDVHLCSALTPSEGNNQLFVPQASTRVSYVGGTVKKIKLKAWGSHAMTVKAVVTCVGTFCVGVLKLSTRRQHAKDDESPIVKLCYQQCAVVVRQSSYYNNNATS